MYATNTYMGHVCGTCIWQIHYMGHLYGTCVGQIPIWNTYVGQVFVKYIICVKYMGHVCENTYMVHICGTFF